MKPPRPLLVALLRIAAVLGSHTYLGELRLRSVKGAQLSCTRSLQDPHSADYERAEEHLCGALSQAIETTGARFSMAACKVDSFACDHGIPLARARLEFAANDTLSTSSVHSQLSMELLTRTAVARIDYMQITDYNECERASTNDCSSDATCYNKVGSFSCSCKRNFVDMSAPGAEGRSCAPKCGSGFCANGGRCVDASAGTCKCTEQYRGNRCEVLKHDLVMLWVVASSLTVLSCAVLPVGVWLCYRLSGRRGDRKAYRALA